MPMTTESHTVLCGQCHRTVAVAVSNMHLPCFRNVEEQADCPEIAQRRGSGEETLLTMMCRALTESLAENLERTAVEVVDREGAWQVACRIPDDANRYYSPGQARGQAEIWDRCGRAGLARRFRNAANEAHRRASSRSRRPVRWLAPVLAMSVVVAGAAWFSRARQPTAVAMQAPALPVEEPAAAAETAAPTRRLLAEAPPSSQAAVPETAAPPPPEAVPETPPAMSSPSAKELASAATSSIIAQGMSAPATTDAAPTSQAAPPPETVAEPEMVSLPGGTFSMGSSLDPSEGPIHSVSVKPFAISKSVVTVRVWNQCVAAKSCSYVPTDEGDDAPVTNLSFNDAQQFIAWLDQVTQKSFRLPTEAEWEYAARGGTRTKYWWGDDMQPGMVNCKGCNGDQHAPQAAKAGDSKPNPLGLYDMGGGVAQWVADCWHKNYQGATVDGSAWVEANCNFHVIRSGSWHNEPSDIRPASRDYYDGRIRYPAHGFRIARSL